MRLWLDGRELSWDCTCPLGREGEFCKHLLATGLAWLAGGEDDAGEAPSELQTIRAFLDAADKQTLVALLVERAAEDDDCAGQLLLSAEAMKRGLRALDHSDDSDGLLGGILSDIAAVHLAAAKKGALPPADLARSLFDLQAQDGFGFFSLEPYVRALGKEGLAVYRKLAADAWKNVPSLEPGACASGDGGRRYEIAGIMKTLARIDGDVDAMVEALQRDLSQPYAYVEIAQTLSKAKRHDEALKWAEDGRKAFPGHPSGALEDFLVTEYHRRKRHDDAIALRWAGFSKHPSLQAYEQLKHATDKAKAWAGWREKALAALRPRHKAKRNFMKRLDRLAPAQPARASNGSDGA